MKFKNYLICSIAMFLVMIALAMVEKYDSYSWPEPSNDIEYRVRGLIMTMGVVIATVVSMITLLSLFLFNYIKRGIGLLANHLNNSDN